VREDVQVELTWDNQPEYFTIPRCGEERRWKEVQKILTRMKLMEPVEREKVARNIAGNFSGTSSPLAMLSEDELRCVANSTCVTIGCHTHGHEILDQLENQEIIDTLRIANEHITRITGYPPHHFSYPNGNFNESILDHVRKAGFETAVTTMPGIWSHEDDRLKIPRIGIGRFDTMGSFKARLSRYL
jgi:peptidoglycan/xylan/chitin deacetylase (PgdA/CDA1 family)